MAYSFPAAVVGGFQVHDGPIHAAVSVHGPELLGPTK
jgi:hypothetical protein